MKSNNLEKPNNWSRNLSSEHVRWKNSGHKFSDGTIKVPIKSSLSFQKQNQIVFENQIGFDSSFFLPVQVQKNLPAGAGSQVLLLPVQVPPLWR